MAEEVGPGGRGSSRPLSLSEHARLTEAILDDAVDAIITIDEMGIVQSFNRGGERLFGYAAEEVVGQNVKMLMPAPYQEEHDGYLRAYRETGHKKIIGIGRRVVARRKDGTEFDAHLAVSEVALPGRRVFAGFVRDISDLTQAQAEIVRAEREMERQQVEHLRREEEVKTKAVRDERQHLSRELHDSVSQALYGIVLGARAALAMLEQDPGKAGEPLAYVLSLAEAGLSEMRALLFDLRPDSLQSEGLVTAFSKHVKSLAQRYELKFDLDMGEEPDAPVEIKHAIHRLTMEAVHNVVKHASASRVELHLRQQPPWILVEIVDDGCGFDCAAVPEGLGITSMRERLAELGGRLELASVPGQGTSVRAFFPFTLPRP